eukprot:scaffold69570_cov59-Phaeocystis_antarctica.AAC.1
MARGSGDAGPGAWMVCGLVWGIGLRRLGCGCGRRLVTGSCVIRETTQTGCPWSRPRVSLSIYLSIPGAVLVGKVSTYLVGGQRRVGSQRWGGSQLPMPRRGGGSGALARRDLGALARCDAEIVVAVARRRRRLSAWWGLGLGLELGLGLGLGLGL